MSEQTDQNNDTGKPPKTSENQSKNNLPRATPNLDAQYTKFSVILAKEIGITAEKLNDLQVKFKPQELFEKLEFMQEVKPEQPRDSNGRYTNNKGRPENQPIVPSSPGAQDPDADLPGVAVGQQNYNPEHLQVSRSISPVNLFKNKKK